MTAPMLAVVGCCCGDDYDGGDGDGDSGFEIDGAARVRRP